MSGQSRPPKAYQEFVERLGAGGGDGQAMELSFREAREADLPAVIALLASDGGGYITGQNIRVDGGITRSV